MLKTGEPGTGDRQKDSCVCRRFAADCIFCIAFLGLTPQAMNLSRLRRSGASTPHFTTSRQ